MIAAVIVSVGMMMVFAGADRPLRRPTIRRSRCWRCRSWCVIGVVLIAEGFGHHVPKGYVYFAMAFSVAVEMLNLRLRPSRSARRGVEPATTPPSSALSRCCATPPRCR